MANTARVTSTASATAWSVLLADYHDDTRVLYCEYLRRQGYVVEEAVDGREALAKAIARRHDIVVSAARLPGIDGYQLCQLLRRDSATSATRVIMVTGDAMAADIERARAAGADATLVKPCLPETLLAEMQRLLELDRARSMSLSAAPDAADDAGIPVDEQARHRRPILSRVHRRGETSTPPLSPPNLRCPVCDKELIYHHSNIGGVSARHAEQWDYFECASQCGTFEYRQRTRKIRRAGNVG